MAVRKHKLTDFLLLFFALILSSYHAFVTALRLDTIVILGSMARTGRYARLQNVDRDTEEEYASSSSSADVHSQKARRRTGATP